MKDEHGNDLEGKHIFWYRPGSSLRACLDRTLMWVNVFLFAMMVVVGTYQILVRYLFNRPSTVSEELLTYAFAWLSLLAATYVFGQSGHMRMGFLADRLEEGSRRILGIATECLTIAFTAVVMVYGGIRITMLTMTQKTASLGIPMGYVYGIVPVCGVLILVYNGMNLMGQIASGNGSADSGCGTETRAEGTRAKETGTEGTRAKETVAEGTGTEETRAEETRAKETGTEETRAKETVAEETGTEGTRVKETRAEETEAGGSRAGKNSTEHETKNGGTDKGNRPAPETSIDGPEHGKEEPV